MTVRVSGGRPLVGSLRVPSDKSLTHRAFMFAGLADGDCEVTRPLRGEDCEATLRCLRALGAVEVVHDDGETVRLRPGVWKTPGADLDAGNSGTTVRLMAGLVAARPLEATFVGDPSLSRRPMRRIAEPLRLMGAGVDGDTLPLRVRGGGLKGIRYESPVASAQVKSCVLLAGLGAEGITEVVEPEPSRDHTERMLAAMDVAFERPDARTVRLAGGQRAGSFSLTVPADISSAAFFLVAAATVPGSRLELRDVGVNPTRTGILDVFAQAGIPVELGDAREELGEPTATLSVGFAEAPRPFVIDGPLVPRLIDEIPVLAVLATRCHGVSTIRGARELRVKESDRIETVATALRAMGAKVETFDDGLAVEGPTPLRAARVEAGLDHRIAMAFSVAALLAEGETEIAGADAVATSFPSFFEDLARLRAL